MQHRHLPREAGDEAPERLGRERDLGDEHDRPQTTCERFSARAQVDLRLPAAGRAVQKEGAAGAERPDDLLQGSLLLGGEVLGRRLRWKRLRPLAPLRARAPGPRLGRDERQRARGRRSVVVGEPESQIDERGRHRAEDALDGDRLDLRRSLVLEADDDAAPPRPPEGNGDDGALLQPVGEVGEGTREGTRGHERVDRGEAGHR